MLVTPGELAPGFSFALSGGSRDGWWLLQNSEVRVRIDAQAAGEWKVEVTASALLLGRVGATNALGCAGEVARLLLQSVAEERVRRVDLCADLTGFDLTDVYAGAWVTPRRSSVDDVAIMRQHSQAAVRTGFNIGKSTVRLRVYDKTEELRLGRNDGDKRDEEHAPWQAAGWNGEEAVTGVES